MGLGEGVERGAPTPFFSKLYRAALLDSRLYEEVEHDPNALRHGIVAIALINVCSGLGAGIYVLGFGAGALLMATIIGLQAALAVARWFILAGCIYVIGAKVFGGVATFTETAGPVAFAYSPVVLQMLLPVALLTPTYESYVLYGLVLGTNLWMFAAQIIAARESLDVSTGKAFLTIVMSFIVYGIISTFLGL